MKVKALTLAALLCAGALTASAQKAGDVRFGVTGGMNVSNITDSSGDARIGFHIGVRGEYNFTNNVYGNVGLLFSQKGTKKDYDDGSSVSFNPGYLELPIHVGYRYDLGNNVSIFGETGPYLAVGVCGKSKYKETLGDASVTVKSDFFGDNGAQRFDGGWGLRVGFEASSFQMHLGYDYGFAKLFDAGSNHNSNFTVGVSYMF